MSTLHVRRGAGFNDWFALNGGRRYSTAAAAFVKTKAAYVRQGSLWKLAWYTVPNTIIGTWSGNISGLNPLDHYVDLDLAWQYQTSQGHELAFEYRVKLYRQVNGLGFSLISNTVHGSTLDVQAHYYYSDNILSGDTQEYYAEYIARWYDAENATEYLDTNGWQTTATLSFVW